MAEGITKTLFPHFEVFSAGLSPTGYVHKFAVEVMKEVGIDISGNLSKGIGDLPEYDWDVVISLCGCSIPKGIRAKRVEIWDIEDPIGKDIGFYRKVRDEIARRIREYFGIK